MRKGCLWVVLAIVLSLCACGGQEAEPAAEAPTWQEQYDLGIRYLSEGNYEEAIIAFTAAIEIDPKQAEAYLKAAEVYEAMGDPDAAKAILERGVNATQDATLQEKLNTLRKFANVPLIPEILTSEYIVFPYAPEEYMEATTELEQILLPVIAAGQADHADELRRILGDDTFLSALKDTLKPGGYVAEYPENQYLRCYMWTQLEDDALFQIFYTEHIFEKSISVEYRPLSGIGFQLFDFRPGKNDSNNPFKIGTMENNLWNGSVTLTILKSDGRRIVEHMGAKDDWLHGEYIKEVFYPDDVEPKYVTHIMYDMGYGVPYWETEDGLKKEKFVQWPSSDGTRGEEALVQYVDSIGTEPQSVSRLA